MDFKQRLTEIKNNSGIRIKEDYSMEEFFDKNEEAEKILSEILKRNKNVILFCALGCDRKQIATYIKDLIPQEQNIEILQNLTDGLQYINAPKVVVLEPNLQDIIKIFKTIISDFKTFVFTMSIKSYGTIIENLRTLISLELPNMKTESIEYLIGASEAVTVYIEKNENGLFDITNIGEIKFKKNNLYTETIFQHSYTPQAELTGESIMDIIKKEEAIKAQKKKLQEEKEEKTDNEDFLESFGDEVLEEVIEDNNSEEDNTLNAENDDKEELDDSFLKNSELYKENSEEEPQETKEAEEPEEQKEAKKANKYKLLKEKLKKKKVSE